MLESNLVCMCIRFLELIENDAADPFARRCCESRYEELECEVFSSRNLPVYPGISQRFLLSQNLKRHLSRYPKFEAVNKNKWAVNVVLGLM